MLVAENMFGDISDLCGPCGGLGLAPSANLKAITTPCSNRPTSAKCRSAQSESIAMLLTTS